MDKRKKYILIVTSEDERYGKNGVQLDFFADNPWEGVLEDIIYGDNWKELFGNGENEGLFYQLYAVINGKMIGRGILDSSSIKEEIEEFEKDGYKLKDDYIEVAETLGWQISLDEEDKTVELRRFSPSGEDFFFCVEARNFCSSVAEFYLDFDVEEHVTRWLEAKNHDFKVPSLEVLIQDAIKIKQMIGELSTKLLLKEIEEEEEN